LYVGALALLAVVLANQVLFVRLRARTLPAWKAETVQRVQSNFTENVPLALILLLVLELQGAQDIVLHVLGSALLACRVLHAFGMSRNPGANYPRLIGAQGTFLLLSVMGVAAIYSFLTEGRV
jgi:uncharacterized membrane protein YecN with MAPEG domain